MKLNDINMITKRTHTNVIKARKEKGLIIKEVTNNRQSGVGLYFYDVDFIKGYDYINIGFTDNRLYFFPTNDKNGYKLIRVHKNDDKDYKIILTGINKTKIDCFVRTDCYTFNFDEECGGYYIVGEEK